MNQDYWQNNISHTGTWVIDIHFTYEMVDEDPMFSQTFNMYNPDIELEQ